MGLGLLLILLAGGAPRLAAQPSPQEVQRLLESGYQRKQAGDLEGALAAFDKVSPRIGAFQSKSLSKCSSGAGR